MKIAFRHLPFNDTQKKELDALASSAGYETIWYPNGSIPAEKELGDCEILMGYFPPDILKNLPNLKWIQSPSAGVEKLCGDIYADRNVVLTNCSGAFGIAISEYMITGLLMLMRNMPVYLENQKQHIWKCMGTCRSIYGSTITVVGMGDIGTKFAQRAKALGAYVRGVRRTLQEKPEYFDEVFTSDRLNEAVQNADAVVLCLPGTKLTTQMISSDCIAHMDSNTIVVNCGRGCTLDQEALTDALSKRRIAGAVLDVTSVEPLPAGHPLWDMDNVIITPHISGHDDDPINVSSIYSIFIENLKRYIEGQPLTHIVDRSKGY